MILFIHHLQLIPPFREIPSEFCYNILYAKFRTVGILESQKFEDTFSYFDRIHGCDRQIDGQTDTT